MLLDIFFNLIPIALVVANLLARCADWQQTAERVHICEGFLEIFDKSSTIFLGLFPLRDIFSNAKCSNDVPIVVESWRSCDTYPDFSSVLGDFLDLAMDRLS